MTYIRFKDLPEKTIFGYNGNKCLKQSTRTANFLEYNRWFYFGKNDLCVVNDYCLLDSNYFR